MDPSLFSPGSWLMKLLGGGSNGGGPFGGMSGALNGSSPTPALPASASGDMPMSGVGPGAPAPGLNLSPAGPGGAQPGLLGSLLSKFGGNNNQPQGQPAQPAQNQQNKNAQAANLIMSALQPKPLQPAQFQWMPMAGPR